MSELLEVLGVNVGTFGNHDLDYGIEWLEEVLF